MAMVSFVQAQEISVDAARQTAAAFIRSHAARIPQKSRKGILKAPLKTPQLRLVHTKMDAQRSGPTLYVFETQQGGYVIASADERAYPVLGYSEDGTFSEDTLNCCMKYILKQYSRQIEDARNQNLPRYVQALENDTRQNIEPLVTCEWSQWAPFNNLCPINPSDPSSGNRCPTGCVATAMAQIMYYHKWPKQGNGSHSYTWSGSVTPLTADFGNTTYRWDLMKDRYDEDRDDPEDAVATLMSHCGVAWHVEYRGDGSSAYFKKEPFEQFFNYSSLSEITIYLDVQIYDELLHRRPVPVSGWDSQISHAYICDGYRTDGYYHFNFGWGPSTLRNNYFKMNSVAGLNYSTNKAVIKVIPKNQEIKDTYGNLYVASGGEACLMKGINEKLDQLNIPSQVTSTDGTIYPVTEIGSEAFQNNSKISNIMIPNSVKRIGDYAFKDCYYLNSVIVPNSVTTIGEETFSSCGFVSFTIPSSVTSIGKNAFSFCKSLTRITIPKSVTTIGERAFFDCVRLTRVTIPNSVTSIRDMTFYSCFDLKSVTIPNSVTTIGNSAFRDCESLTNLDIPSSVATIDEKAFFSCISLKNVSFPNSVKSIGNDAFGNCRSLTTVYATRLNPSEYNAHEKSFESINNKCTLYVPKGCKEAYANTVPWSNFTNIIEMDMTGIEDITSDLSVQPKEYYKPDGQRIAQPQSGVNIIRYSDGTSRKMLVK